MQLQMNGNGRASRCSVEGRVARPPSVGDSTSRKTSGTKRSSLTSSSHPVPLSPQQCPASVSFPVFIAFSSLPSRLGYPPGSAGFCLLCKLGHLCLEPDQTPTEAASVVLVGTEGPAGVQDAFSTCFGHQRVTCRQQPWGSPCFRSFPLGPHLTPTPSPGLSGQSFIPFRSRIPRNRLLLVMTVR